MGLAFGHFDFELFPAFAEVPVELEGLVGDLAEDGLSAQDAEGADRASAGTVFDFHAGQVVGVPAQHALEAVLVLLPLPPLAHALDEIVVQEGGSGRLQRLAEQILHDARLLHLLLRAAEVLVEVGRRVEGGLCVLHVEARQFVHRQRTVGHFVVHYVGVSLVRLHFGIAGRLREGEHVEQMVGQLSVVD